MHWIAFPRKRSYGTVMTSHEGCWQVFGLTSTAALPTYSPLLPSLSASALSGFVLVYRCGAVPDFHRVPLNLSSCSGTSMTPIYRGQIGPVNQDVGVSRSQGVRPARRWATGW